LKKKTCFCKNKMCLGGQACEDGLELTCNPWAPHEEWMNGIYGQETLFHFIPAVPIVNHSG
jgi:hypothetical protein